jgi:hypothetical protein
MAGDRRLSVTLLFFLLGPLVGALLAAAMACLMGQPQGGERGLDVFGLIVMIGYLSALVPAALTGWAMSGLYRRMADPLAWIAAGIVAGGLISGLTCLAAIALIDACVHGSLRVPSYVAGEITFIILFAVHGAMAGGVCAAVATRTRARRGPQNAALL